MLQGGGETPKALSSRVLVAAYWLFVVLMLATFTANLAAFLTVTSIGTTINTLEELMAQSQVQYGLVENQAAHQLMKVTRSKIVDIIKISRSFR